MKSEEPLKTLPYCKEKKYFFLRTVRMKIQVKTFEGWKQKGSLIKNIYCLDFQAQTTEKGSVFQ